jgi:hypothetical protein
MTDSKGIRGILTPPIPASVADALARHPLPVRARLLEIRALIYSVAAKTKGVGPLTETLKWGEPAYLTEATKSGTTIRLGRVRSAPEACAVLFNCKTTLIPDFHAQFNGELLFDGDRAIVLSVDRPVTDALLSTFLVAALTYHRRERELR